MIGSAVLLRDSSLTVLGGGATCFSMGTYWEVRTYELDVSGLVGIGNPLQSRPFCQYLDSPKIVTKTRGDDTNAASKGRATRTMVPRISMRSKEQFEGLLRDGNPVVIEGLEIGPCLRTWTPEYMVDQVGRDKEVSLMPTTNPSTPVGLSR